MQLVLLIIFYEYNVENIETQGGFFMKNYSIEERAISLAHYIIDSKDTVRGAAKKFGISKSTVHKDVTL